MNGRPNIVLVHGAWADGSCWSGVIERLQAAGYQVRAPPVPADVARRRRRAPSPGAGIPGRPDDRRRALLRWPDHHRARQRCPERGRLSSTSPRSASTRASRSVRCSPRDR